MKITAIQLFFILLHPVLLQCQYGQPYFEQFLTDQGLPSREVYVSYQDKDGIMWFGTDNGITRYDGHEFTNYSTTSIYEDNVINSIIEDNKGVLWFGSMFGDIFYLENKQLHPYQYNNIIRTYRGKFITSTFEYIDKSGTFYLGLFDLGILEISKDGKQKLYTSDHYTQYIIKQIENRVIGTRSIVESYTTRHKRKAYGIKLYKDGNETNIYLKDFFPTGYERFFNMEIGKDSIIYFFIDRLCFIKNNKVYATKVRDKVNNITVDGDKIYLCFGNHKGVSITNHNEICKNTIQTNYLVNQTVSSVFIDKQKSLWITTINNGVFYSRRPEIKIWSPGNSQSDDIVSCIAPVDQDNCYFGDGISNIHLLEKHKSKPVTPFPSNAGHCDDMEMVRDKLYALGGYLYKNKWNYIFQKDQQNKIFTFKEISFQATSNAIWVTNYRSFAGFDLSNSIAQHQSMINDEKFVRIYDILASKNGGVWIACQEGLFKYENGKIHNYSELNKELNIRINTLVEDEENNLFIGTKDYGLIAYNVSSNKIEIINNELSKDYIRNTFIDDNQNLWVSTNKGLYKYKKENGIYQYRKFTKAHGLPTEEIFQCKTSGNTIWLATSKGLVKFFEPPIGNFSQRPNITTIESNHKEFKKQSTISFKHNENNLIVTYKTTNYRLQKDILYRIKSNIDTLWRYTKSTQMELIGLHPGLYHYEIQSANEDFVWSDSTYLNFKISTPWWKTYTFIIFLSLAFVSLLLVAHKSRTRRIRQESKLIAKVNKLEKMALQSQMNPHFISNVFSSLQYMINTNKLILAEEYLTDLSALIRRILENSRKTEVNLKQELDLLKLYINLELVRYENKFDVIFNIDNDLNIESISIPPMMLQPIVENAITHGLHHLENRKGKLILTGEQFGNKFKFTIEDNGIGRKKSIESFSSKPHKSFALEILKERIININNIESGKISFEIIDKNQIDEFGTTIIFEFSL